MKCIYMCLIAGLISSGILIAKELPEPYRSVDILPFDDHGWFAQNNRIRLEYIIDKLKPKVVVELGSWLGASTIFMAEKLSEGAILYAVDNWNQQGSAGVQNNPLWSSKLKTLYQSFLSNVIHKKMTQIVIPIRMDTLEAARALNITAELVYVDASHEEEDVYNDIIHWYPHLDIGGIMCGDDWSFQSVRNAVRRAEKELNQRTKSVGNFWWVGTKS